MMVSIVTDYVVVTRIFERRQQTTPISTYCVKIRLQAQIFVDCSHIVATQKVLTYSLCILHELQKLLLLFIRTVILR
jgi:hypothetical protein